MTPEERLLKIEIYGSAYIQLVGALEQFPREMWHFKPAPDRWSIHEIVIHISDSEANSYIRGRKGIVEPGQPVMAYNEVLWAEVLNYRKQSTSDALELFRWLRQNTFQLLLALPEEAWSHTLEHPENGRMTLEDWLEVYARHIPDHIAQMQANYEAWNKQQK